MKPILFHIQDYGQLTQRVLQAAAIEAGKLEVKHFSDGERYQRILSPVDDRDVFLLGGAISDSHALELFDLACTIVRNGANSLSLIMPYFGYSTMEREVMRGEVVTAKTRAKLFSSIPKSHKGNRLYLFDLHTEGIPYYFENDLQPTHVYCKSIVMQAAKTLAGDKFVLASTDAGRAKWVESLANDMNVGAAFILKRRLEGDKTEVSAVNADVSEKNVVIYDDMIRSGGSIINAAQVYKEAGAKKIFVITTHGLFIDGALDKLAGCGLIDKVIATDSHANVNQMRHEILEIYSLEELIKDIILHKER